MMQDNSSVQYYPYIVSTIALVLSAFSFYWTSIREKKAFYLIRVSNWFDLNNPEFALVNGGKRDILITRIQVFFENKDGNGGLYPVHELTIKEGSSLLLGAGKAFHCTISYSYPFEESWVITGTPRGDSRNVYNHKLKLEVEWVEMSGKIHKRSVYHSLVGFRPSGEIVTGQPLGEKYDLYAKGD